MARWNATTAWTALLALQLGTGCSGEGSAGGGDDETTSGGGGSQGAGAGAVASSSSTGIGPGPGSTGSGGGGTVVCDPPAPAGSIYEKTAVSYDIDKIDPVSMCGYRGEVMLIVNIAAL